jgi:hypothetical protein
LPLISLDFLLLVKFLAGLSPMEEEDAERGSENPSAVEYRCAAEIEGRVSIWSCSECLLCCEDMLGTINVKIT